MSIFSIKSAFKFHQCGVSSLSSCSKGTRFCSTHDGFAVAGGGLLVLAAEEQTVALLLELLCGGAFLGAARHLLRWLCGGRSPLLPDPVPRLFGEHRPVPGTQTPANLLTLQEHTHNNNGHIRTTLIHIYSLHSAHNTHIWTLISCGT